MLCNASRLKRDGFAQREIATALAMSEGIVEKHVALGSRRCARLRSEDAFVVPSVLDSDAIGTVRRVDCHCNVPVPCSPGELRYNESLGGGAMMDLGCYPAHRARNVVGEEPNVISANADWHESGVDTAMEAEVEFARGATANVSCSMSENLSDRLDAGLTVPGEKGTLAVDNPLAPHIGHKLTLETDPGVVSEKLGSESTYYYQL